VVCLQNLASLYLQKVDYEGKVQYDALDRPAKLAAEALAIVERIVGETDKFSYLRAKALARVGRAELVKKDREKAETIFLEAQT